VQIECEVAGPLCGGIWMIRPRRIAAGHHLAERQLRLHADAERSRAGHLRHDFLQRRGAAGAPCVPAASWLAANTGSAIARATGMQMRIACNQYSTAGVTIRRNAEHAEKPSEQLGAARTQA